MSVVDRTSSEFKDAVELYQRADLLELGRLADAERWRHPSRQRGQLHHRPQHQLHQRLRRRLRVLRVLPTAQAQRGLRAELRADRRQDRRVQGDRRRPDSPPGRAQPVHPVRVVSRPHALHQAQSPDPHPWVLALRSRLLQRALRFVGGRRGARAPRRGARQHSGRRWRNSGGRGAPAGGSQEGRRPRSGSAFRRRRIGRG